MSDNLILDNQTFLNVAGFKVVDTNNNILTYVRPQGTKTITTNGTGIDVAQYATVDINVPSVNISQDQDGYMVMDNSGIYNYVADKIAMRQFPEGLISLQATEIKQYAFYNTPITSIYAPNLTKIEPYGMASCASLQSVNLPVVTTLGNNSFQNCENLVTVNIPNISTLGTYSFANCKKLENLDISNITTIPNYCFHGASIKGIITNPIILNDSGFRDCRNWWITIFPNLTTINGTFAMAGIIKEGTTGTNTVNTLVFPALTSLGGRSNFSYNQGLVAIDFNNLTQLRNETFYLDALLTTIILRKTSAITTLENINCFNNTPFANNGIGGTIYIPEVLYNHLGDGTSLDYKAATNWSTIDGYGTITWAKIEGSQYENYYADGTLIV